MNKNRYIISCSGSASRWGNYLNCRKHLIPINNEALLDRTIRIIHEIDDNADVCVYAFEKIYERKNATLCVPTLFPKEKHVKYPAIYTTKEYWNKNGNTAVLFGDVYYTKNAITTIYKNMHTLNFYGREKGSKITGKTYGELFGISFNNKQHEGIMFYLNILKALYDKKVIRIFLTWQLYRILNRIPLNKQVITDYFIEIDDLTDDFDFPEDYDVWIKNYNLIMSKKL